MTFREKMIEDKLGAERRGEFIGKRTPEAES